MVGEKHKSKKRKGICNQYGCKEVSEQKVPIEAVRDL